MDIIILFDEAFKYGDGAKFICYIRTDTEPLCIEFCNVVQYHAFVYYLTVCRLVHLRVPINSI
jgi:hypothetical protein